MILNAALALVCGSLLGALTVAAHLGAASGLVVMGCTITAFCVLEGVRKANPSKPS